MKERAALAQLAVGMDHSSPKMVARTVGVLVKGVSPEAIRANVEKVQAMEEVVEENGQKVTRPASAFTRTQALLTDLMHQGADIQPGVVQAAKSLLLADGVAREVDPTWSPERGIKTLAKDVMKDPLLVVKDRPKMPDAAEVAGFAKLGELVTGEPRMLRRLRRRASVHSAQRVALRKRRIRTLRTFKRSELSSLSERKRGLAEPRRREAVRAACVSLGGAATVRPKGI